MRVTPDIKNLLVIDVETASVVPDYENLNERFKPLWDRKAKKFDAESDPSEVFSSRAALYAEFGRIISIGVGYFHLNENEETCLRVKVFAGKDEKEILNDFKQLVEEKFDQNKLTFVAHNGKEFDYPFLCRRMLVHGISLPVVLDFYNKKPWEIPHEDTMQMWRFGEVRNYTSLELLAALFGIESSKTDMDGSMVSGVFHKEGDLDRIKEYCRNDVIVTARIYLRLQVLPDLKPENIFKV
ncbi:3'-5' exonuclease [Chondrinema litorale]|uniref:3'-5' exonuclease n=1 Tax=Chondrinema litorale TaxID=2994555 RepID=UPI0025431AE8|nr:3'-5' exonuclease [Chondrinema litorale]UZR92721.1 3'-5' exonuclease [Chondrinema litorale]